MPIKSETPYAILAMLAIRPMSAYELVKFAENSIGFFWNESYGNIHQHLQRMESGGFVDLVDQDSEGRRKKIYAITVRGRAHLKAWILQNPDETIIRDTLLLKIFSAQPDQFPQLRGMLQQEQQQMHEAQTAFSHIKEILANLDQDPARKALWLLTLRYGEEYGATRQAWCREAFNILLAMEKEI